MCKFVLLLVIIVNGVLSVPSFAEEWESEPRVFAQRDSNTNRMLQADEHVHALYEDRRLTVSFKPEPVNLSTLGEKSPSYLSRIANWFKNLKTTTRLAWTLFRTGFHNPDQALLMGYTPGYYISVWRKFDPTFTYLKNPDPGGDMYQKLLRFGEYYDDLQHHQGSIKDLAEKLSNVEKQMKDMSWISRIRARIAMWKTRRLLNKGVPEEKLLEKGVSPYLYFRWLKEKQGSIPTLQDGFVNWFATKDAMAWLKYQRLYDKKFPYPRKGIDYAKIP
ncbi:hypothetical protein Plhal710r2_c037g0132831 [Plasmopara halstedii]